MSSGIASTGPHVNRPGGNRGDSFENVSIDNDKTQVRIDPGNILKKSATALSSSKLVNQAPKKIKMTHHSLDVEQGVNPMDKLLARLSETKATITRQEQSLSSGDESVAYNRTVDYISTSSNNSVPTSANTETINGHNTGPSSTLSFEIAEDKPSPSVDEYARLMKELESAKGKIALMDEELAQSRINKSIGKTDDSVPDADYSLPVPGGISDAHIGYGSNDGQSDFGRGSSWARQDDARSDTSDSHSVGGFTRARSIWGNDSNGNNNQHLPNFHRGFPAVPNLQRATTGYHNNTFAGDRGYGIPYSDGGSVGQNLPSRPVQERFSPDHNFMTSGTNGANDYRNNNNRATKYGNGTRTQYPFLSTASAFDNLTNPTFYGNATGANGSMSHYTSGHMGYMSHQVGTQLSPYAPEFNSAGAMTTWKNDGAKGEGYTYLPTVEPLNYRRLLDRTVSCNWKYIVDKIVCNNDQQASIFLQQKLKVGTVEQKHEIVEAIVAQAYPLMINRFGNFLVQRCFEHGTPEQVVQIAEAIRGHTLTLSMDAFGCHVVQKAFDSVPEEYKAVMVNELLRRIPETVIHRYACHVWQKLFELRWTGPPPEIMNYVNDALRGMWHEVALGETGSLVVQNIFENCLEDDKRPCIEEVLQSIDIVAHGQFGNWCIQHICEHGAPPDRSRAIDHVIRYATEYSMDQFASKVVEKCLKIGGSEFLERYLNRVCEGSLDRPRIPLIDVASDQYGNYLIQYILTHSAPVHRDIVAAHIRKHMVSLRGSKFGSRVGMLCTNPAVATRPGPGAGPSMNGGQRMPPQGGPRYGNSYR